MVIDCDWVGAAAQFWSPFWNQSITQVPGKPWPPLSVTTFPEMLQEPGVVCEVSIPNVTCRPDEAVPESVYGTCVEQGLQGDVDVMVTVCVAFAMVTFC